MPVDVTQFHTMMVGDSQDIRVDFPDEAGSYAFAASISSQERAGRTPVRQTLNVSPRTFTVDFYLRNASILPKDFRALVYAVTDPGLGSRLVYGLHEDGVIPVVLTVDCQRAYQNQGDPWRLMHAQVTAFDASWRDQVLQTHTGTTVSQLGDTRTFPTLKLHPSAVAIKWRRFTVGDNTGRGMANHLVRLTFDTTGTGATAATNYQVFYRGRTIPFGWRISGANASIDVRLDIPAAYQDYVDIYYGSGLTNTITPQSLDYGNLDPTAGTFANNNPVWGSYVVSSAPAVDLEWVPARSGNRSTTFGTSVGLTDESNTQVVFDVAADDTLTDDTDSMVVVLGPAAATSNALVNLKRVLSNVKTPASSIQTIATPASVSATAGTFTIFYNDVDGSQEQSWPIAYDASAAYVQSVLEVFAGIGPGNVSVAIVGNNYVITFQGDLAFVEVGKISVGDQSLTNAGGNEVTITWGVQTVAVGETVRAFVRYRTANAIAWKDAWTSTTPVTIESAINVPGAVAIAVGIEALAKGATGTLTISAGSGGELACAVGSEAPTVVVGAATDARWVNGLIQYPGTTTLITVNDLYMPDTDLVIDADAQTIKTANGGAFYGSISFADPDLLVWLEKGSNVFSGTQDFLTATFNWEYFRRWMM